MRFMIIVAFLALTGCAPLTYKQTIRSEASHQLSMCIKHAQRPSYNMIQVMRCYERTERFCVRHGLEAGCGEDWIWTEQPVRR